MTTQRCPQADPRSIEALVTAALTETDDEVAWDAVCALQWRGSRDVLQCAERLSLSECTAERRLAADILGQLGLPDRTFPEESAKILFQMLEVENDAAILKTIFIAFSHLNDVRVIPMAEKLSTHLNSEVRYGVALAVMALDEQRAISLLIRLTQDTDSKVRDWATFGIGTISEVDTPEVRDALADRMADADDDARGEALVGLARRKDQRVVEALKRELSGECIGTLSVEAAELIGSAELRSLLLELRDWWDVDAELLERAIAASQ